MKFGAGKIKKEIVKSIRKRSIAKRLRTAFICTTVVPLILLGILFSISYEQDMEKKLTDTFMQVLQGLNKTMDVTMTKFLDYSYPMIVSDQVNELLNTPDSKGEDTKIEDIVADNNLTEYFWSESYDNILLYDNEITIVSSMGVSEPDKAGIMAVVEKLSATGKNHSWSCVMTDTGKNAITFLKRIYSKSERGKQIGYICFVFNEKRLFQNIYKDVNIGNDSEIFVLDRELQYLSLKHEKTKIGSSAAEDIPEIKEKITGDKGNFTTVYNGRRSLIVYQYNKKLDWTLLTVVDQSYISQNIIHMVILTGTMVILIIILSLFIVSVINETIVIPISRLVEFTDQVSGGKYDLTISDNSEDEMGKLIRYSDKMVKRLVWYTRTIEEEGKKRRKLEIQNLQYQIQPHFLFNTLNTFKYIAIINGVESLGNGISALCSLLKDTVYGKEEMIPLSDEIRNVQNYICIQEFRYTGCIRMVYEVEEAAGVFKVPRLLLQLLTENSIVHGMKEEVAITISITARLEENDLYLEIQDDGKGFVAELTKETKKQRFSGIGMENIAERIQLIYQGKGQFLVYSAPGKGTRIVIVIPGKGELPCTEL